MLDLNATCEHCGSDPPLPLGDRAVCWDCITSEERVPCSAPAWETPELRDMEMQLAGLAYVEAFYAAEDGSPMTMWARSAERSWRRCPT
jgi:hypothetical protein